MQTGRVVQLMSRLGGRGGVRKPVEGMAEWLLTVWANSLGVEEKDALVHDATNGTSSRHQPTGQTT